jgi:hypothetical protein
MQRRVCLKLSELDIILSNVENPFVSAKRLVNNWLANVSVTYCICVDLSLADIPLVVVYLNHHILFSGGRKTSLGNEICNLLMD